MPSSKYPYLNRGAYKWVPDDYSLTSNSAMGFTRAYYPAQVDYGLPINCLPKGTPQSGYAREVRVFGRGLYDFKGESLGSGTVEASDNSKTAEVMSAPFLKTIMRGQDSHLQELPVPEDTDGIGIYYEKDASDPPWLFVGGDNRVLAGMLFKYALSMDTSVFKGEVTTPMSLVAIYDKNTVGSLWLSTARGDSTSTWGPPTRELQAATGYEAIIAEVASKLSISSGDLAGAYIPFYLFDAKDPRKMLSLPELQVSDTSGVLDPTLSLEQLFRLSGSNWTITDYFPKLVGFVVGPNMNPMKDGSKPWNKGPWKASVLKIGEYDAIKSNGMPARGDEPAQFPCKIFGYALRINQAVEMSKYTAALQPAIGQNMSKDPGNGLGTRQSTFWFKLFHPDPKYSTVGFAHGLRFYYLIAALPLPGTSPLYGSGSLVGTLAALEADQDLIMVQFIRILAGWQSLVFSFGDGQQGSNIGRVAYAGAYGAYSRNISGLKAFRNEGKGTPNSSWKQLGPPDLPTTDPNGVKGMWYDAAGTPLSYYSFTDSSLSGGFTPAIAGAPRTDLGDKGNFSMSTSLFSTFSGTPATTVYAKPRLIGSNKPDGYCSAANAKAHLATFVSDPRKTSFMYTGDWRIKFDASVDDTTKLNSQVFFRFAIVDNSAWEGTSETPNSSRNAHALWSIANKIEFHFEQIDGKWYIASGPPTDWNDTIISTLTLGTQTKTYDLVWFLEGAKKGDPIFTSSDPSPDSDMEIFENQIQIKLSGSLGGNSFSISNPRIVVQAWSVASVRDGVPTSITPENNRFYPAVALTWGGTTGASLQTTLIETLTDTLFPQQDPYVIQSGSKTYTRVVATDKGSGPGTSAGAAFRDVPLYGNVLSFGPTPEELPISGRLLLSSDETPSGSKISLANFSPDSYYDSSIDRVQSASFLLADSDGSRILVAGATADIDNAKMSFKYKTNRSTFDTALEFELQAIYLDGRSAYTIAKSPRFFIRTGGSDAAQESEGEISDLAFQAGPVEGIVPHESLYLGIAVRVWPYVNANAKVPLNGTDGADWNRAFCSIDMSDFIIENLNIEVLNDYRYISGKGGQDFYQGLPITTARTFGASDYTVVVDEEVLKTQIIVPRAATSSQFGYWYFSGTLFSPFYMFDDEMPAGCAFATRQGNVLLSGNSGAQTLPDGIWIRTAVDEIPSQGLSSDREATPFGMVGYLARPRSSTESTGNFMTVMTLAGQDVDGTRVENIVKSGGEVVSGKNPLIVTPDREFGFAGMRPRFRPNVNARTKILMYEDSDLSDKAGSPVIAMLVNTDGTCTSWQSPPVGEVTSGKLVLDTYMSMLSASVSLMNGTLHLAGYRPLDPKNPASGGAIILKSFSSGMINGVETTTLSPYHYVDGKLQQKPDQENYSWNTGGGPLLPDRSTSIMASNQLELAAAESFPDLVVDSSDYIHVFYPLMTTDNSQTDYALGRVFCKTSINSGYAFSNPRVVMDLGYTMAKQASWAGKISSNDQSFAVKHPVVLYDGQNSMFAMFVWAGGKIFMRVFTHPNATNLMSADPGPVFLVAGDTSFAIRDPGTGLEGWLRHNWDLGVQQKINPAFGITDSYASNYYATDAKQNGQTKTNNYGIQQKNDGTKVMPWVQIIRYYNEVDVPAQRIGAFMDSNQEISLFYNDALGNLVYRRIRTRGAVPYISPPFILATTTL